MSCRIELSLTSYPSLCSRCLSATPFRRSEEDGLNKVSRTITQPKSQGASQAMLYATGLEKEDMSKAQVGISSVWWEATRATCT
jgi:dihydroxy-acid dehydratase